MTEPTAESLRRAQSCFSLICEQDIPIDAFEVRHIARAIDEAVAEKVAAERARAQVMVDAANRLIASKGWQHGRCSGREDCGCGLMAAVKQWEEGAK